MTYSTNFLETTAMLVNTEHVEGLEGFKHRLKQVMQSDSARVFSRKCDLSEGAIRSYLSGETYPTLDRLAQIAKAANTQPLELAFGMRKENTVTRSSEVCIPLYDARAHLSATGEWLKNAPPLGDLPFAALLRDAQNLNPDHLAGLRHEGDAMSPLLREGDVILLNHQRTEIRTDGLYVLVLDGWLQTKRLQRQPDGSITIISDNHAYRDVSLAKSEMGQLIIAGTVVWHGRWLI